ncbi:hypothetical protein [Pontibacter anaerobius]|uniref:Carboxypeptidase regulatory-like domain-containing protein n=1 Tax=Pontibacter anaerobius TaxID=2993940 RepID=A0ABT3RIQ6_9BACT|nr:hypothetical protein [Pontibacter anaerobius]MCX2741507.1 hypothetical protein [Pontibacter anaerobius]
MLHLCKKLNKLTGTLLLLALLTSCEKEESTTEFTGKVIDLDTNQSVAGTDVDLFIWNGLSKEMSLTTPEVIDGSTNNQGEYKFVKTPREGQTVYWVTPEKAGYLEVKDVIGKVIKPNERNVLDINIARGSYFKLNINNSVSTPGKDLKVTLSYPLNASASPVSGMMYNSEIINYNAATTTAELLRGFYFKRTTFVLLKWDVTTDSATESNTVSIPLVEHDTTFYEINY